MQIACKLTGFRVANGNDWWYKLASPPWNGDYYVSADAFYNNGSTSGSLHGTPYFDPAVADCGSAEPPPSHPVASPSVNLAQGPAAPSGFRYAITLDNFPAASTVSITCYDSATPEGFYPFALTTDASGHAMTAAYCYSGDGPEHWVLANGIESNHVAWAGSSSGGTKPVPTDPGPPNGGGGGSDQGPGATPSDPGATSRAVVTDQCIAAYQAGGAASTHSIFGGSETNYDRTASLYQVCRGFGAPDELHYSPEMQCALIAAAATFGGPVVNVGVTRGCDAGKVYDSIKDHDWLGPVNGQACAIFSDVFAKAVGIFAAAASSETGPGAVAVGVKTYQVIAASLKIVCAGLLDGGASTFGYNLESHHEMGVAVDITREGKCLRERRVFGLVSWSAANC